MIPLSAASCQVADATSRPFHTPAGVNLPLPTPLPTSTLKVIPATPIPADTPSPLQAGKPVFGGRSAGDPYAPDIGNTGYDVQHYHLNLWLSPPDQQIRGVVVIDALSAVPLLEGLMLDFVGYQITELFVNGEYAEYQRDAGKLAILLPKPIEYNTTFTIEVAYAGAPPQVQSRYVPFLPALGLQFTSDGVFVVSEPDGARNWFPCNDHPTDKATFSFEMTVPADYQAAANGLLREVRPESEGAQTFAWDHDYPMATYLATVAVGRYQVVETTAPSGLPIRSYIYPEKAVAFQAATRNTAAFIEWMEEIFVPYPFEAIGFAMVSEINASLETQTMVILSENMLNENTVIHELAHMWFGNWVSMASWADMWHNEGFATYLTYMWAYRERAEDLNAYMEGEIQRTLATSHPPLGNLPPSNLFGSASYNKGAALVHVLRLEVGDEAFFGGLREYLNTYGGGTATRNDFQTIMEDASGKDLDAFFARWLE